MLGSVSGYGNARGMVASTSESKASARLLDQHTGGIDSHLADRSVMSTDKTNFPIVAIGASAGGLYATTRLIDALPKSPGMAFILIQHLDPTHKSLMADLLAKHTVTAARHVAELTPRQREIMDLVLAGHPSKNIAADLAISQRPVENHRASIMNKMDAKSLPELARQALAAERNGEAGHR
jgi:two-component system CheB/CheR fusion protein